MTQTLKELIPGRKTPEHEFVMRFNEIVRYLNLNPIGTGASGIGIDGGSASSTYGDSEVDGGSA